MSTDEKLDSIFTEWPDEDRTLTGRFRQHEPEIQHMPFQGLVSDSHRVAYRQLAKCFNFATGDSYSASQQTVKLLQVAAHDETYVRNIVCDYASVEYGMLRSLCGAIGPRAPKRKRRKRLAKKLKQRGGMLKTRGIVQSYFDAWPGMRFWWGR